MHTFICRRPPQHIYTTNPPQIQNNYKQYEAAFGLYTGAMGALRARLLPEASRATVMNQIRLLLNALVVGVYVLQAHASTRTPNSQSPYIH